MRRNISKILVAGVLALTAASAATAQETRTGYFLEDYTYRFMMNPAMDNNRGFVSFPGLGNLNIGVQGNLGVSDVLYSVNGKTVTFMHPSVSAAEVMGNIHDENRFGTEVTLPVLAVGFKGIGGYNTIAVNAKVSSQFKLPGSIFSLLKEGIANKTYNIGEIDAFARAYTEVMLGHSRQINKQLRVGANLKVIFAGANARLDMEQAQLELGTDSWRVVSEGKINANIKGLSYETKVNESTGNRYISDVKFDDAKPDAFGMAVDLGAVYNPTFLPDLKISAAVVDLGFIRWGTNMLASTNGRQVFSTDKYTFNVDDNAPNSFDNEFDKIKDEFSSLYELRDMGDQGSMTSALAATVNVGAQYTLPMYRPASFGLLSTTRVNGEFTWTDVRVSANWAPCKVFDASISGGAGTFGASFGWLVNLHCPGFNLFAGMDNTPMKFTKDSAPLNSNISLNFGLNFLF